LGGAVTAREKRFILAELKNASYKMQREIKDRTRATACVNKRRGETLSIHPGFSF
jgi:methylmalonyl-CoA mutase N-terminal domain/subunit